MKTPSSLYWRMLSSVSAVISLEWSTGKMKFEACPVEPPGLGSGPLSISVMSVAPSRVEVVGEAVADDAGADDDYSLDRLARLSTLAMALIYQTHVSRRNVGDQSAPTKRAGRRKRAGRTKRAAD